MFPSEDISKYNDRLFYGFLVFFTIVIGLFGWMISQ
jgi:hypothetical protein